MRRGLWFLICLLGFVPFSNLRAQAVYSFPREVQTVLANRYFVYGISQLESEAERVGGKLEIRHVQVNVGTGVTTVDVITASTTPDGSRLEPAPNPPLRRILSFEVKGRVNGTIEVVAVRTTVLRHLPDAQEFFPKELSALIVHGDYRRILEKLWAEMAKRGDSASRDLIVLRGRILSLRRGGLDLAVVNREGPSITLPYKTLFGPPPHEGSNFLRVEGVTENPDGPTEVASIREAKPLPLPESPKAEPANRVRQKEAKPADVDLAKETEKSVREGKARREGKGRGGRK